MAIRNSAAVAAMADLARIKAELSPANIGYTATSVVFLINHRDGLYARKLSDSDARRQLRSTWLSDQNGDPRHDVVALPYEHRRRRRGAWSACSIRSEAQTGTKDKRLPPVKRWLIGLTKCLKGLPYLTWPKYASRNNNSSFSRTFYEMIISTTILTVLFIVCINHRIT